MAQNSNISKHVQYIFISKADCQDSLYYIIFFQEILNQGRLSCHENLAECKSALQIYHGL